MGALPSSPLDLDALRKAVASLREALAVVGGRAWFDAQPPAVRDTLRAGVVQNFEIAYEISVKMLKRRIEMDAAVPGEIDGLSFRELLRLAGERGLVGDVPAWFGYRQMRNITAHTYDVAKAKQVLDGLPAFLLDAEALLAGLEARNG
jgi:nucleotidyltransferase substrate binding protein (TIGR01987 family)